MTIRKACIEGIRQTNRSFLLVLLLFAVNFLLAGIVAMLFQSVVSSSFENSLAPLNLVRDFDFTVYIDFVTKNHGKLRSVYALITWFIVLNNFLSAFFDGGIIASVQSGTQPFRFQSFCASCGEFFGRFIRLFIIVVPVMLLSGLVTIFLGGMVSSVVIGTGETEIQLLKGFAVEVVVFLLPLSMLILASDYARVITVVEHERRMFRAFWHGVQFVFRKLFNVFFLFLLWFILSMLLLGCWVALTTQVVVDSGLMVLGIFLVQQIIAIGRSWVRVVSTGCEVALYVGSKSVVQEPLPSVPEMPIEKEEEPQQIPAPVEVLEINPARVVKPKVRRYRPKKRGELRQTKRIIKRPSQRAKF